MLGYIMYSIGPYNMGLPTRKLRASVMTPSLYTTLRIDGVFYSIPSKVWRIALIVEDEFIVQHFLASPEKGYTSYIVWPFGGNII